MQTKLSFQPRAAIVLLSLVLAMPVWAPLGMNLAGRLARGTASPMTVAVNWNSNVSTRPTPAP